MWVSVILAQLFSRLYQAGTFRSVSRLVFDAFIAAVDLWKRFSSKDRRIGAHISPYPERSRENQEVEHLTNNRFALSAAQDIDHAERLPCRIGVGLATQDICHLGRPPRRSSKGH